jgi:hypothetical protein
MTLESLFHEIASLSLAMTVSTSQDHHVALQAPLDDGWVADAPRDDAHLIVIFFPTTTEKVNLHTLYCCALYISNAMMQRD